MKAPPSMKEITGTEWTVRKAYADQHATTLDGWWEWFKEAPVTCERAPRPGLLVRWWFWKMERKCRKAQR